MRSLAAVALCALALCVTPARGQALPSSRGAFPYLNVGAPANVTTTAGQVRAAGDISALSFGYSQLGSNGVTQGVSFSGADTSVRAATGFTVHLNDGATSVADFSAANGIQALQVAGTAGSGTGITTNVTASVRQFVHKITVAETALTAAATTQDVTIWTVPGKTRLTRIVADATVGFTGGGLTNMTVTCGSAPGSTNYLLSGSIFAAATLGDVAAEIGAGLLSATVADIPSFSSTTGISCRFTSTTANVVAATAGSVTFYIEGVTYP